MGVAAPGSAVQQHVGPACTTGLPFFAKMETGVTSVWFDREWQTVRWTRAEVAETLLHVPSATLRTWERTTGFRPTGASTFQEFTPATYDAGDVALLRIIQHASSIGLAGVALAKVHDIATQLRTHFLPGWSGVAVLSTDGRAWLVGAGVPGPPSVDQVVSLLPPGAQILLASRVEVPRD